jgi:hypothetical protein
MPRKPIDYSKSMFYKLVCKDITIRDLYVGSTTDFKSRKSKHKSNCNNETEPAYNYKVYIFIRDNGGWENWDMVMIHRQSCVDELEAHKMEKDFMETLGATLNSNVPGRTISEYKALHIDEKKKYNALYLEANKDKVMKVRALYLEANKDKIKKYRDLHKDVAKDYNISYRKENKEQLKEKSKIYREANRDSINMRKKELRANKKLLKQESLGVLI